MDTDIDYDALKARGFLREKQDGFFTLRTRMLFGNYGEHQLRRLAKISRKYAKGFVHLTVRQGVEIPFIKFEDIEKVEKEIKDSGVLTGTSGPRLRTTTTCPGNNWCKRGLIDTFSLFKKIEEKGIKCGLVLPHKFKIVISGCPNTCTRAQSSEIGIYGEVDAVTKKIGYAVYLGGCGGVTPHIGFKLNQILTTEEQVLDLIERVVNFYHGNAKPRQRLALLIKEIGKEKFLKEIGFSDNK